MFRHTYQNNLMFFQKTLFKLQELTWVTNLLRKTAILFSPAGLVFTATAFNTFSLSGISAVMKHTGP